MELYSTKFKKLLNFFQKDFFLYFRRKLSNLEKQKKIHSEETSYISLKKVFLICCGDC